MGRFDYKKNQIELSSITKQPLKGQTNKQVIIHFTVQMHLFVNYKTGFQKYSIPKYLSIYKEFHPLLSSIEATCIPTMLFYIMAISNVLQGSQI